MKISPTITQHEFIGFEARIVNSPNPNYIGITGTIINETRNTFQIIQDDKSKIIVKEQAIFHFTLPDSTIVEIDGKILVGRPEERLKKRIRRLW